VGPAIYREHCAQWFESWQGPIGCERRDLIINTGGDVGFATCLTHNSGTLKDGSPMDFWVRVTVGFKKIDGRWKVVHEHISVPFNMETMQPCFNLQP
jgi:ketosteroid isomerase-like protein